MKRFLIIVIAAVAFAGCRGNAPAAGTADSTAVDTLSSTGVANWNGYKNIAPADIPENAIELISKQWMLVTSGDSTSYNTMTASWGALGEIWSRDVALITIRNTRYTYEFLQRNDVFTLSFFDLEYRPAMTLLGTKSGRDGDKVAESGLTPMATPSGSMSFSEARMIIECRKLYEDKLDPKKIFDDEIAQDYIKTPGESHQLFIGEIIGVWVK
jgi:flavin reductase (DIM6/NTAB) family NADH-FMN oxidoreductase RutF